MMKQLRKEGFKIGRYRVHTLMKKLNLVVKRKKRFVLTTGQQTCISCGKKPAEPGVQASGEEPGMDNRRRRTSGPCRGGYAVVIDLYSRRVVGWRLDRRMKTALVSGALRMAINLRKPPKGLLHHSDRGSQYASHGYQELLRQHGMVCSMSRKGNCWDNAPTERFFSSRKREWLTGNFYPTREDAVADVRAYIAYYNSRRLHTTLGDMRPIEFEKCA